MTPFRISFRIWGITVFLNAVYFGLTGMVMSDIWKVVLSIPVFFLGVIAGVPFLGLLTGLVKTAGKIPYATHVRIVWICFCTITGIVLYYLLLMFIVSGEFSLQDEDVQILTGTTIAAFITAMWWSGRRLCELDGMKTGMN